MDAFILSVFLFCAQADTYQIALNSPCIEWLGNEQTGRLTPYSSSHIQEGTGGDTFQYRMGSTAPALQIIGQAKIVAEVMFDMESDIPLNWPELTDNGTKYRVHGYASPDGKDPEHRIDLARKRATVVKDYLLDNQFKVSDMTASVCEPATQQSMCWRAIIIED